jgi:hypothetical protein
MLPTDALIARRALISNAAMSAAKALEASAGSSVAHQGLDVR